MMKKPITMPITMPIKKPIAMIGAAALLSACAQAPIIDRQGVSEEQYQRDYADCQQYAAQVNTGGEAAKGGAIGAAIGGALGAVVGNSGTAARGAGVGAISGAAKGSNRAERRKETVLYNCLRGRGYRVLG